jgi:hypothetical protein
MSTSSTRWNRAIRTNLLAALVTALVVAVPAHGRQTGPEAEAEAFRQRLLDALARGDRSAVAGMIQYRLIVEAGFLIPVGDRAELFRLWNIVFSPATRCLIEESGFPRPGAPPKYAMQLDAAGVALGDGRIRAVRGAGGFKITHITLPSGYGEGTGSKPREVRFRWGKGSVAYAGRLSGDNVDVYVVQARKGDLLNAQLQRVRADRASVRVVQQAGNRVIPTKGPAAADRRRLWAGPVPETGAYRIEVVRQGAFCDPPVNYQLTVSLE